MKRELLLLRHAKSAWDSTVTDDFARPLAKRGLKDAPRIGKWVRARNIQPDAVLSSPARRCYETALAVAQELPFQAADIQFDRCLYEASLPVLQERVRGLSSSWRRVLLVGHDPGLDELLIWCCPAADDARENGKLLTTGAVAHILGPTDWTHFDAGQCRLLTLTRPRDMVT